MNLLAAGPGNPGGGVGPERLRGGQDPLADLGREPLDELRRPPRGRAGADPSPSPDRHCRARTSSASASASSRLVAGRKSPCVSW